MSHATASTGGRGKGKEKPSLRCERSSTSLEYLESLLQEHRENTRRASQPENRNSISNQKQAATVSDQGQELPKVRANGTRTIKTSRSSSVPDQRSPTNSVPQNPLLPIVTNTNIWKERKDALALAARFTQAPENSLARGSSSKPSPTKTSAQNGRSPTNPAFLNNLLEIIKEANTDKVSILTTSPSIHVSEVAHSESTELPDKVSNMPTPKIYVQPPPGFEHLPARRLASDGELSYQDKSNNGSESSPSDMATQAHLQVRQAELEHQRLQQEAENKLKQQRLQQKAKRELEQQRLQQEADREREQQRLQQEADKEREQQRLQQEAEREAEKQRREQEAEREREREQQRLEQEAKIKLEQQRLQQEGEQNWDSDSDSESFVRVEVELPEYIKKHRIDCENAISFDREDDILYCPTEFLDSEDLKVLKERQDQAEQMKKRNAFLNVKEKIYAPSSNPDSKHTRCRSRHSSPNTELETSPLMDQDQQQEHPQLLTEQPATSVRGKKGKERKPRRKVEANLNVPTITPVPGRYTTTAVSDGSQDRQRYTPVTISEGSHQDRQQSNQGFQSGNPWGPQYSSLQLSNPQATPFVSNTPQAYQGYSGGRLIPIGALDSYGREQTNTDSPLMSRSTLRGTVISSSGPSNPEAPPFVSKLVSNYTQQLASGIRRANYPNWPNQAALVNLNQAMNNAQIFDRLQYDNHAGAMPHLSHAQQQQWQQQSSSVINYTPTGAAPATPATPFVFTVSEAPQSNLSQVMQTIQAQTSNLPQVMQAIQAQALQAQQAIQSPGQAASMIPLPIEIPMPIDVMGIRCLSNKCLKDGPRHVRRGMYCSWCGTFCPKQGSAGMGGKALTDEEN